MIVACLCEGTAEEVILSKLLAAGLLIFSVDDLIDNKVLRIRNGSRFAHQHLNHSFEEKVIVYRILDSKTEKFKLPKPYQEKVSIHNVITKPEIEMLLIISEGQLEDFERLHDIKPSDYAKTLFKGENIKSRAFNETYWTAFNLRDCLRKYNQITTFPQGYIGLYDLIDQRFKA